jgi:hypothetical protein
MEMGSHLMMRRLSTGLRQDAVKSKFDNSAKAGVLNSTIITTPMILNWLL